MNSNDGKALESMFRVDGETMAYEAKSFRAAMGGKPVQCRGCGDSFALCLMFRCFHCRCYFCSACARVHFGECHDCSDGFRIGMGGGHDQQS